LLTEISMNPTKKSEIPGRTAAMEDLALHHFLMGFHPRISNIVKCRSPRNLNEAIGFAISEEKFCKLFIENQKTLKKTKSLLIIFNISQNLIKNLTGLFQAHPIMHLYLDPLRDIRVNLLLDPFKVSSRNAISTGLLKALQINNKQRINFVDDESPPDEGQYYEEVEDQPGSAVLDDQSYDEYYEEDDLENNLNA
ncbi:jg18563, partial [Pararge aegeria aegeria]